MRTKYQIRKKRDRDLTDHILIHPLLTGDHIYEFDTIEECQLKIDEIKNWEMYLDVILSIVEVYYEQ